MPLFKREPKTTPNSATNSTRTSPNSSPITNHGFDANQPTPLTLPNTKSTTSMTSMNGDTEGRVSRSSSMSRKFKSLFTGGGNNSNGNAENKPNNDVDVLKSIKSGTYQPPLPIPDRSLGRSTNKQVGSRSTNFNDNVDNLRKMTIKEPELNDIDCELNIPEDEVIETLKQEHEQQFQDDGHGARGQGLGKEGEYSQHPRFRSSTISTMSFRNANESSKIPGSQPASSRSRSNSASDSRRLKHSETVSVGSTHLKNERDIRIKLCDRICIYEFGRCHEHDYSKFKTHLNKSSTGLFSWMKKKENKSENDESYAMIEKSISLLPDKYSGNLMKVKNNPKNYIWNYDDDEEEDGDDDYDYDDYITDDDEDEDEDEDGYTDNQHVKHRKSIHSMPSSRNSNFAKSIKSNRSTLSRQSKLITRHYNSDDEYEDENDYEKHLAENDSSDNDDNMGTKVKDTSNKVDHVGNKSDDNSDGSYEDDDGDDDDDDDDDDDFDDEIDNMMIEPIIGKEQVFLINSMLSKIENPDKFMERVREKERLGKVKLTMAQKYGHIEGVIGKGSYGTVCISSKTVNNTQVFYAIKQIKRKQGESLRHFGNRVTSEFMISSSLTHQAVINVYDLMVDPISLTYSEIMEFIPCGDLFSLISNTNGLNIVECDCFFKQILNAITYLHSVGVSHNDLKVENLLLTRKGQLKITDFGTSAVFKTAWENEVQLSLGACGSERYVAPEQYIKDLEYDPRLGDVWSLGVIYLTMYYGKYSWEASKLDDESFTRYVETRAKYDYSRKSTTRAHQFLCLRRGAYPPIENIKGGIQHTWVSKGGVRDGNSRENEEELINDSRRYVLYNILNPDPTFRMRTYQIWQSEWIKNFRVCDAGRGYVSYDNYIEMAMKSVRDIQAKERDREMERDKDKDREKSKEQKKSHGFLGFKV
ncbi:uncharacterized protein C5L36_0E03290 [Pichia kudriavzevii]|uniref:Protein kinase domain-containing protein n=1 Tax=Pichia kudriavzevii TaxID=4909 RepID=A0A2U9RAU4_PICKU|nr:uncharacterized protein C5L36_0E03290 [Pichia kudriavzevii]AWU78271.1 hypothetical protein C5L36_0E03290 [Pichia kudriavzevii]